MKVDAILPAGGRIAGAFAAQAGTEIKALIALGGQPMLELTLDALRATQQVGRIVVIGPDELKNHPATRAADAVLPEADSGPANVFRGLQWLEESDGGKQYTQSSQGGARRVLVVTTDLPFLTSQAVGGFLEACPLNVDICLPVIRREAFQQRFPNTGGSYVYLSDGAWTIGGIFLFDAAAVTRNRVCIDRVFAARKSGVKMAMLLGPRIIARFLCRRLTVTHVQGRCEQMLGCSGAAVPGCAPELAFDIDLPEEYRYALRLMKSSDPVIP